MACKVRRLKVKFLKNFIRACCFDAFSSENIKKDIGLVNRMISECARNGDLDSAQKLFDEMPNRDVVSWNSIVAAHAHNDCDEEALRIFSQLHRSSVRPSFTSLSTVLSSCAKLRASYEGEQVHGLSVKLRASQNVFVGTSLITMYSKCGVCDVLIRVFDDMDSPNTATWNALISAFVANERISDAREVFDQMPTRNVVSWTAIIGGYIDVKKVGAAFELFKSMAGKNAVTWAVMIGGFVSDEQFEEALQLFNALLNTGMRVTSACITKAIGACSGLRDAKQGRNIHGLVIKHGFHSKRIVEAALVSMYCHCLDIEKAKLEFDRMAYKFIESWHSLMRGCIDKDHVDEARRLFDRMTERDDVSWNMMVSGYAGQNRISEAIDLFFKIPKPSIEATTALMSCYAKNGRIEDAKKLFDSMPGADVTAYTTLIHGYMQSGMLDNAWEHFNRMPKPNVVTYNVMISGLLQHGKASEAYSLFTKSPLQDAATWNALVIGFVHYGLYVEAFRLYRNMLFANTTPTELIVASLLRASARLSLLIPGEEIHAVAIKRGHGAHLIVGNSLINMYSKCGEMALAKSVFNQMIKHDVVSWNVLINGYARHGSGKNAVEMFEEMKKETHIKPDEVTFLCLLSACSHDCLLSEAEHYLSCMEFDFGIAPRLSHYACVIDLLSRKGMVEKAEKLTKTMPFEPDPGIWTSLLSGSRSCSNIEVAEAAASKLSVYDPTDPMPYLQLMNIYGTTGRVIDMENVRDRINRFPSVRQRGCSWIET